MSSISSTQSPARWKTRGFLILRIVLALAFCAAAVFKLSGAAPVVTEFDQVGLGQWFRYVTAACELSGTILLLVPTRIGLGALILTCVCVGAFFAQLMLLHGDVVHTIVLAAILGAIAWMQRDKLFS